MTFTLIVSDTVKLILRVWPYDSSFYYETSQPVVSKYEVADYKARLFLLITNLQLLFALYLVHAQKNYNL
jgi:hypothetical protein